MPSTMSAPLITLSTSNALLRDLRSTYNTNDDSEITFVPFPTTSILPPPVATETQHRPRPRRASKTMRRILPSKKRNTKPKTKKNKEWDRDLWDDDDTRDDAAYTLTATVFRHTEDDTPASRCRILSSKKRGTKPTKKTNERKDEHPYWDDDHRDDEFRDTTGDDEDWTTSRITIIKATESTPWDTTITNDHDGDDQINSLDGTMRSIAVNASTTADNASNYHMIRTPATAPPVGTKRYSKTDDHSASLYSNIIPSLLQSWNNFETGIINEINTTTTTTSNSNINIRTILGGGSCYTDTTATATATVSRPKDYLPVGGCAAGGTLVTNDDVTTSLCSTTNLVDIDAFSCGREGGGNTTTNEQAKRGIIKNMTMIGHWMATKTGDTNTKMQPPAIPPLDGTDITDLYTTLRRNCRNDDDDGDDDIRDQPGGNITLSSSSPVATITSAKAMEQRWRHYQQQLRQQQQQNQQQQNHHRGFTDNNNKKERDERKESKSKSTTGLLKQRLERKHLEGRRNILDQQEEKVQRQSKGSQPYVQSTKYEKEESRKKTLLKKKKHKNNPSIINRLRCRDASIATPGQAEEDGNYNWTEQAVKAGVATKITVHNQPIAMW